MSRSERQCRIILDFPAEQTATSLFEWIQLSQKNCTAVFIRLLLRNNRYSNGKKNDKMQIAFWKNISLFSISTILHIPRLTRILCQCMNLYKNLLLYKVLPNFYEILYDVFILLLIFLILIISHINYTNSFTVPKITNLPRIDVKRMFH